MQLCILWHQKFELETIWSRLSQTPNLWKEMMKSMRGNQGKVNSISRKISGKIWELCLSIAVATLWTLPYTTFLNIGPSVSAAMHKLITTDFRLFCLIFKMVAVPIAASFSFSAANGSSQISVYFYLFLWLNVNDQSFVLKVRNVAGLLL